MQGVIPIIGILTVIVFVWFLVALRRWLLRPSRGRLPVAENEEELTGRTVDLLLDQGYDVFAGKRRIPLRIRVNGEKTYHSRLFVDYYASKGKKLFVVRKANRRRPLEWSGSAIRDQLLSLALIYDRIDGVLYIDDNKIHTIEFELEID